MSATLINGTEVSLHSGDLPTAVIESARRVGVVAIDTETSGLDWTRSQVALCQLYIPAARLDLVRINGVYPEGLAAVLKDPAVVKIFHHATFDLRFMLHSWNIEARNVVCTKIASKILWPESSDHSLKSLLKAHLNVLVSKDQRTSDWFTESLTPEQLTYAASDVFYLPELFDRLKHLLEMHEQWDLACEAFAFLPSRVKLDIIGAGDVFAY